MSSDGPIKMTKYNIKIILLLIIIALQIYIGSFIIIRTFAVEPAANMQYFMYKYYDNELYNFYYPIYKISVTLGFGRHNKDREEIPEYKLNQP